MSTEKLKINCKAQK